MTIYADGKEDDQQASTTSPLTIAPASAEIFAHDVDDGSGPAFRYGQCRESQNGNRDGNNLFHSEPPGNPTRCAPSLT